MYTGRGSEVYLEEAISYTKEEVSHTRERQTAIPGKMQSGIIPRGGSHIPKEGTVRYYQGEAISYAR